GGRLAGPVGTEKSQDLPGPDRERHIVHCGERAIALREMTDLYHALVSVWCCCALKDPSDCACARRFRSCRRGSRNWASTDRPVRVLRRAERSAPESSGGRGFVVRRALSREGPGFSSAFVAFFKPTNPSEFKDS